MRRGDRGALRCWGTITGPGGRAVDLDALVPGDLGAVEQVTSESSTHLCALGVDRSVRCFGAYPRLIPAGTAIEWVDAESFVPPGMGPAQQLFDSMHHTCALLEDGELRCWGLHAALIPEPEVAAELGTVAQLVSLGSAVACARLTGGSVHCWGQQAPYGPLVPPADLEPTQQLAGVGGPAKGYRACALQNDGLMRCWSNGDQAAASVPSELGPATRMWLSDSVTCAQRTDGTLVCWGSDAQSVPESLGPVSHAAPLNSCAVDELGELNCWGRIRWRASDFRP